MGEERIFRDCGLNNLEYLIILAEYKKSFRVGTRGVNYEDEKNR